MAIVVAAPGVASAATAADVDGFWTSVDGDGSDQIVGISRVSGDQFRAVLFDDDATVCGGGPALARGSGSLSGDTLTIGYQVRCFNGADAGPAEIDYMYDEGSNKLTDGFGVVWTNIFG